MSIADLQPGPAIDAKIGGMVRHDYSHLLRPEHQKHYQSVYRGAIMGWKFLLEKRQYNCESWTCVSIDYNQKLVKVLDSQGNERFFSWEAWQKFPLLSV